MRNHFTGDIDKIKYGLTLITGMSTTGDLAVGFIVIEVRKISVKNSEWMTGTSRFLDEYDYVFKVLIGKYLCDTR